MLGIYSSVGRMPFVHKTQGLIPITVWAGHLGMVGTTVIQHSEDRGRKIRKKIEVITNFVSEKGLSSERF